MEISKSLHPFPHSSTVFHIPCLAHLVCELSLGGIAGTGSLKLRAAPYRGWGFPGAPQLNRWLCQRAAIPEHRSAFCVGDGAGERSSFR